MHSQALNTTILHSRKSHIMSCTVNVQVSGAEIKISALSDIILHIQISTDT